eukprot:133382_1
MDNQLNSKTKDEFIIKYAHNKSKFNKETHSSLDMRRTVFISLLRLYQCFLITPSHILYACLIFLPLKKIWIYKPFRYRRSCTVLHLRSLRTHKFKDDGIDKKKEFIQFLKWKDSQNSVFWMLDDYQNRCTKTSSENGDHNINPFWLFVNERFTNLYNYNPLNLNKDYWENKQMSKSE